MSTILSMLMAALLAQASLGSSAASGERIAASIRVLDVNADGRLDQLRQAGDGSLSIAQLHAAAYSLGLVMRSILGAGTPRRLRGLHGVLEGACRVAQRRVSAIWLRRIDELRRFILTRYSLAGVGMPRKTATSATRC